MRKKFINGNVHYVGNQFETHIHRTKFIDKFPYLPRCLNCFPKNKPYSKEEKEVAKYCKLFFPDLETNKRSYIYPYQLDIIIPEINLAIEYNGDYWHNKKPAGYHEMKTNKCKEVGLTLIHIWEHDWINNKENVKKMLKNIFQNNK